MSGRDSSVLDRADDLGQQIADFTERNLSVVRRWLTDKQSSHAHADSTLLGVAVNSIMTLLGVAVAWHWAGSPLLAAAGVAWAVLNGYPLAVALWRWLV